jgi:putative flippase GtrA
MTKKDIIFSVVCGLSVSWIAIDFLGIWGLIFVVAFPIMSIIGLWIFEKISKKYPFFLQLGKFGLAGAFADVADIKIFQLFFLFLPFSMTCKAISFFAATIIKYFSDKYWAFEKYEKHDMHKEMAKFFMVAIVGSVINVASFFVFSKIETGLNPYIWQEVCIILAALVTAIWNFSGYKFIVFKK